MVAVFADCGLGSAHGAGGLFGQHKARSMGGRRKGAGNGERCSCNLESRGGTHDVSLMQIYGFIWEKRERRRLRRNNGDAFC